MPLSPKQSQNLGIAIRNRLMILKANIPDRRLLLDGLRSLLEGKKLNDYYDPLLKILNSPHETDSSIEPLSVEVAVAFVRDAIEREILSIENNLKVLEQTEDQRRKDEKAQVEAQYKKLIAEMPTYLACNIPKSAFALQTNMIQRIDADIANAITIGGADEILNGDESTKLDNVLHYGFNRAGMLTPDKIQVILKFQNLFQMNFFKENKLGGLKQVEKYFTPHPNRDFSGAALVTKEERLRMCKEHGHADVVYHQKCLRRNEIISELASRGSFLQNQMDRLASDAANYTNKFIRFSQIRDRLLELVQEIERASPESLTEVAATRYKDEIARADRNIQNVSSVHRDTGWKALATLTFLRNPTSQREYVCNFNHKSGVSNK